MLTTVFIVKICMNGFFLTGHKFTSDVWKFDSYESQLHKLRASVAASKNRCTRTTDSLTLRSKCLRNLQRGNEICRSPRSGSIANSAVTVREQQTPTHGSQLARRLTATKALSRDKLTSISLLCSWRPWWNVLVSDLLGEVEGKILCCLHWSAALTLIFGRQWGTFKGFSALHIFKFFIMQR